MITQEQIKDLKPGDRLLHDVYFIESDGVYIKCHLPLCDAFDKMTFDIAAASVSLPTKRPKYDPCRLFRTGDKVRVVECKGRRTGYDKKIYKVCEDEEESGRCIKLSLNDYIGHFTVDAAYLELATPVEAIAPYFIYESIDNESFDIMKRVGKMKLTRNCIYYKSDFNDHAELTREEALAAAEAECKRLNDEWQTKVCRSEEGKEEV